MKIFYRSEQTADTNLSFSPSARKPALVMHRWAMVSPPTKVNSFLPLRREDLALAHDRSYVDAVLDLRVRNGFGNKSPEVARSLPYTSASLYAAARHAFKTGESAASPTSGFHHAGYASGGGYCTFNGLMVAAQKLHAEGAREIGVLDLDQHYGDGTVDIAKRLDLDYLVHYTFGGHGITKKDAFEWLNDLPDIVNKFATCDVVLYQAGADPHVDDPLGGVLTTEQLFDRDIIVFTRLKSLGVPVAWNLAGGYQNPLDKVLDIHDNTFRACLAAE